MSRKTFMLLLRITAVVILIAVVTPNLIVYYSQPIDRDDDFGYSTETVRGSAVAIIEEGFITLGDVTQPYQTLQIIITEGQFEGQTYQIDYGTRQIRNDMTPITVGDQLMVTVSSLPDGRTTAHFTDFNRTNSLFLLTIIFVITSILISGLKGIRSIIGILLSLGVIIFIILPGIQQGRDPLLVTILGSTFFVAYSLYIIYGWNMKTHAALLGSFISLIITGFIALIFVNHSQLSGYGDENMFFISQLTQNTLNVRSLLLAGILIGTLGVLDDLVISQASAVFELYRNRPDQTFTELFSSAMNIGKDHIAATVNTLVLAYAGASLPMLLLFSFRNVNYLIAINLEFIAEEIVRTLVGSLGLLTAVPITTSLAALIAINYRNFGKFRIYLGPLNE